jgi:nicotinamide riboside transporter PnuC
MENKMGWIGSICGIAGAILLSLNLSFSGYGYLFYLLSSFALIVWAVIAKAKHTLVMQLCFCVINFIGVYNWLLR